MSGSESPVPVDVYRDHDGDLFVNRAGRWQCLIFEPDGDHWTNSCEEPGAEDMATWTLHPPQIDDQAQRDAADEIARLRADNDRLAALVAAADEFGDRHVIDFRAEGWTIAHPLSCRAAGLFQCPVGAAATDLPAPPTLGRYGVTVSDGQIVVGDPVEARP